MEELDQIEVLSKIVKEVLDLEINNLNPDSVYLEGRHKAVLELIVYVLDSKGIEHKRLEKKHRLYECCVLVAVGSNEYSLSWHYHLVDPLNRFAELLLSDVKTKSFKSCKEFIEFDFSTI